MRDTFEQIYRDNGWQNAESVSGNGSTLAATKVIREALPLIVGQLGIRTILDIPCGDYNWFSHIKFSPEILYTGMDIVPQLIYDLNQKYGDPPRVSFGEWDIARDVLSVAVDLVFVRDLFGHFTNLQVRDALRNVRESGSRYLLATTFPRGDDNVDIETGQWRPIDLSSIRFGLGKPQLLISECCAVPGFADKSLGLWEINE